LIPLSPNKDVRKNDEKKPAACLSPNKDIRKNDEKKPAALKPSKTEFDRIAALLDNGTMFLKNDFYDHFGDIASTTPQGNFDCYHHTPVVLDPEARQHLLESQIAENEMNDTVALLLQMFFQRAIFYQPDTQDGVSSTGRTSVVVRSNETAYTRMRALCPHGISPASDLPHMLDTSENRELRGFFFEFIEEFLGRYGLMIHDTTYNLRLQDMPAGTKLDSHVDGLYNAMRGTGIHMRAVWSIGGPAEVSFQGHKRTPATKSDDEYGAVADVKYIVNTTEAHVYVTTAFAHGCMQLCYVNKDMTEGIQVFHKVNRVAIARCSAVLDWTVDLDKVSTVMTNVRDASKISMSNDLYHRFTAWVKRVSNTKL
jgi:hypothetical protein